MTAETNCLDCEGSITVHFEVFGRDESIGARPSIGVWAVTHNPDCRCDVQVEIKPPFWTDDLHEHAHEAVGQHLIHLDEGFEA